MQKYRKHDRPLEKQQTAIKMTSFVVRTDITLNVPASSVWLLVCMGAWVRIPLSAHFVRSFSSIITELTFYYTIN